MPARKTTLGVCYGRGTGVARDLAAAAAWFTKAAEQGNATAQVHLGFAYMHGAGLARDTARAAGWFEKAAAQGVEVAAAERAAAELARLRAADAAPAAAP